MEDPIGLLLASLTPLRMAQHRPPTPGERRVDKLLRDVGRAQCAHSKTTKELGLPPRAKCVKRLGPNHPGLGGL